MIKLRNMAAAYIFNDDEVLMMKRSADKKFFPNFWAPVGGHMEPDEINNPKKACLREIEEEIGLDEADLENLRLKYITVRRKDDEIRIQYIFFATTSVREFKECDEGELYWIKQADLLNLKMSVTNRSVLEHYFKAVNEQEDIYVGVFDAPEGCPEANWTIVKSFDTFY